jgi:hypothetical protein
MDSKNSQPPSDDEEGKNAEAAFADCRRTGQTDRRCLRCGGRFVFRDGGSGYSITCERGDFREAVRGI